MNSSDREDDIEAQNVRTVIENVMEGEKNVKNTNGRDIVMII